MKYQKKKIQNSFSQQKKASTPNKQPIETQHNRKNHSDTNQKLNHPSHMKKKNTENHYDPIQGKDLEALTKRAAFVSEFTALRSASMCLEYTLKRNIRLKPPEKSLHMHAPPTRNVYIFFNPPLKYGPTPNGKSYSAHVSNFHLFLSEKRIHKYRGKIEGSL